MGKHRGFSQNINNLQQTIFLLNLSLSSATALALYPPVPNTYFFVRKYSAVTPGGMSKEVSGKGETTSLSKFPAVGKGGKKATTLFLQSTLLARVSRKLGREKVSPRHVYGKQSQIFDRSYGIILLTSNIVFSINNIMRNPDSLRTLELSRVI